MFASKFFAVSMLSGAALLVGCQSTGSTANTPPQEASEMRAVACNKCQTTFKSVPAISGNSRAGHRVVGYHTVRNHECPECRNVATEVLNRGGKGNIPGQVIHSCKTCGGEIKECHVSETG